MKRKSKGQRERESKISQREAKRLDSLVNDPWFKSLPPLVQLKLTGFIKQQVEAYMGVYEELGYEEGMYDCMSCVVQVLAEDYWKKAPVKKWNKFVYDVSDLMNSHLRHVVTWEEMRQYIKEKAHLDLEPKHMGKIGRPTPRDLFGGNTA